MMAGYVIQSQSATVLTLAVAILSYKTRQLPPNGGGASKRFLSVFMSCYEAFYDCAILFGLSIQIASIVVLARFDFGTDVIDMGGCTVNITWALSNLTVLPLTYVALVPTLLRREGNTALTDTSTDVKERLRFNLFAFCWLLSVYPFLSRMIETFGPSKIGGNESVISNDDWAIISETCLAGVKAIGGGESTAMDGFSIAGSLFVFVLAVTKIIWLALERQHPKSVIVGNIRARYSQSAKVENHMLAGLLVIIPILTISQLWTAFRWRSFQAQVSSASGNQDTDNLWTFGQIAAMTIFLPVLIEIWLAWSQKT